MKKKKTDVFNLGEDSVISHKTFIDIEERLKKQELFSTHHLQLFTETLSALSRDREEFRKFSARVNKLYKIGLVFSIFTLISILILLYFCLLGI